MPDEAEEKIDNVDDFYEGDDQWYDIDEFVEDSERGENDDED